MTKKEVREILERVKEWPEDRQEDAARVLSEMEAYDASDYHLSEEQAQEVRRRLSEKNPKTMSLGEFRGRLHNRYGV
jgi:hypothetical protein